MKLLALLVVMLANVCILGTCKPSASENVEVALEPLAVGTKTELYEVVASGKLKLAPGIKYKVVPDLGGRKNVIMLLREDGRPAGGYITCECGPGLAGTCTASSDNPENDPTCTGGCQNSEHVPVACGTRGNIGPPHDPPVGRIKFVNR